MEQRRNIIRGQRGNIFPRIIFLEYIIEVPVIFSKALKTVLDELFGSKYADGWMDHEANKTLGRPRCIVGDICYRSISARATCHLHNASRWKLKVDAARCRWFKRRHTTIAFDPKMRHQQIKLWFIASWSHSSGALQSTPRIKYQLCWSSITAITTCKSNNDISNLQFLTMMLEHTGMTG